MGAVLPGCSSHLFEESLPGKTRDEFLEAGGPTSSSSSQGRQGLWAPATGRPGGAKVLVRRGSARSQAERHGPARPAGGSSRTEAEGPFQPLTGYGRSAGKRDVQESAAEEGPAPGAGGWLASPLPPRVTGRTRPAGSSRGGAGLGAAPLRLSRHSARRPRGAAPCPAPEPSRGQRL